MFGRKNLSPFLSDHKSEFDSLPSRNAISLNPLDIFPSKSDPLSLGLFSKSLIVPQKFQKPYHRPGQRIEVGREGHSENGREEDDPTLEPQWLNQERIDPDFGIKVDKFMCVSLRLYYFVTYTFYLGVG